MISLSRVLRTLILIVIIENSESRIGYLSIFWSWGELGTVLDEGVGGEQC